jgi:hypothetical protein
LKALDYSNQGQSGVPVRDARRAIRFVGTNGFPLYLQMLQATDSPLKLQLMALAQKQRWFKIHFTTASAMRSEAQAAFSTLGVRARSAVPALNQLYKNTSRPESKVAIAQILGNLGPAAREAVPMLQSESSTNASVRSAASNALQNMNRSQPSVLINLETSRLNDLRGFDTRRQAESARSLYADSIFGGQRFGSALPVLLELLRAPRTNSYWIGFALEKLDPDAADSFVPISRAAGDRAEHPMEAATIDESTALSGDSARLLAAGSWSEPVVDGMHKLRGRLLVYESLGNRKDRLPGRRPALFLELQEVTGALNFFPATVYFDGRDGFDPELRDAQGSLVAPTQSAEGSRAPASWTIVPFDGSVRFPVDQAEATTPANPDGSVIQLGSRAWHVSMGDTNGYFLSATFTPSKQHKSPLDYDVWGGTLKLPRVLISVHQP